MQKPRFTILVVGLVLGLGGCGQGNGGRLHDFRSNVDGPEEFAVLPTKPLETPPSFASLPEPTPGGANITDQYPKQDAIAALGGNPARLTPSGGIPSSDSALVSRAARYGVPANTREVLAQEDLEYRQRRGRLVNIKIVAKDRYNDVYKTYWLDSRQVLARYRRAGVRTPSVPPPR